MRRSSPTTIDTIQRVFPLSDLRIAQMMRRIIEMGMAIQLRNPSRGIKATRVMSNATIPKNVPIVQFVFRV